MKIYTSYFANMRALSRAGIMCISIARFSPKWYVGKKYLAVAPTGFMLSSACRHDEYLQKYDEILQRLNPAAVVATITSMSEGKDVALCCYEKPGDFCHRHLLAEWLTKNGYQVEEWKPEEKKGTAIQLSLFE